MTTNEKRGSTCCNSSFLLFKAIVNQFTRLNEYFKVLFNAKSERIYDKRLKHECDLIGLVWVEILGTWVSRLLDMGLGLQAL